MKKITKKVYSDCFLRLPFENENGDYILDIKDLIVKLEEVYNQGYNAVYLDFESTHHYNNIESLYLEFKGYKEVEETDEELETRTTVEEEIKLLKELKAKYPNE